MRHLWILFMLIIANFFSWGQSVLPLQLNKNITSYDLEFETIETSIDSITIAHVINREINTWQKNATPIGDKIYWGKASLNNPNQNVASYILEFGLNDYVDVYLISQDSIMSHQQSGELVPKHLKALMHGRKPCLFTLVIPSNSKVDIYFKIRNVIHTNPILNPRITLSHKWYEKSKVESAIQWAYQGFLWVFIIYSLVVYFVERDKVYLYFFSYVFSLSIYFSWYFGIVHEFIFTSYPILNTHFMLMGGLIPICYFLFIKSLIASTNTEVKKIIKVIVLISLVIVVLTSIIFIITHDRDLTLLILNNMLIGHMLLGMFLLVKLHLTKDRLNRLLVLGTFMLVSLSSIGVVAEYYLDMSGALYLIQLGSVLELIVFSIAIGYRIKVIHWKKKKMDAMMILQSNKNEMLQIEINDKLGRTISMKELELKEKNKLLNNTVDGLKTSNEELKQFAYIVSHDLKAPLRGINSLAEFLLEDHGKDLNEDGRNLVKLIENRILKMDFLIGAILKYSKITSQKQEYTETDVKLVVKEVIDILEIPAHVKVKVQKNLPTVTADAIQLQQVFQNLVGNSIKFANSESGKIEISWEDHGLDWEFRVKDNGVGIDPKYYEKVFGIFQTLHPSEDGMANSGVGLAIVKKIIESHGGSIKVVSELGVFTEFIFNIPKKPIR